MPILWSFANSVPEVREEIAISYIVLEIFYPKVTHITFVHTTLAKAIHMMKSVDNRVGSYNPVPERNSKYLQTIIESTTLPISICADPNPK